VGGLALLGTTWPMRVSAALLTAARDDEAAAIEMVARWSHAETAAGAAAIDTTRALMRRVADHGPARLLHTDLNACNLYAHGAQAAAATLCPALLILGTQDLMTPARKARAAAAALAHAQIIEVEAGHAMLAEQPHAVSAALIAWRPAYRTASPRTTQPERCDAWPSNFANGM
jgi:pimeloyl-ACP methyl ester carboxylesterase